jgi:hypothetical protein
MDKYNEQSPHYATLCMATLSIAQPLYLQGQTHAMKHAIILIFSAVLLTTASCKKEATGQPGAVQYPLHLHIQADFDNDFVQVLINHQPVFSSVVTTNDMLGLSEVIRA